MHSNYRAKISGALPTTVQKIAIVIAPLGGGGAERVVVDLSDYLARQVGTLRC